MSRAAGAALPPFSPALAALFARYLRGYLRRHFDAVRVARDGMPEQTDGPLVIYSNHAAWWDPLLYVVLARAFFPGREGYGPMDAEQLERYRFFRRLGVFGVRPSARGAWVFLRTAEAVLARPGAVLWLTAEGVFRDPRVRPIALRPGLGHLAARAGGRLTVLPLALEYPFWDQRLPQALAAFGAPIRIDGDARGDGKTWTRRFEDALETTMDRLAAAAQRRDPAAFETLIAGRTGVGGVYDLWRRARARAGGRSFEPAHGAGRGDGTP